MNTVTAPLIDDLFAMTELSGMLEQGYVRCQSHLTLPLAILNYTEMAQFDRVWNLVTRQCRGLIYNTTTREIVARPFPKFFNYGEPGPMGDVELNPAEPVIVTDKLDGSLGVLYDDGDGGAIATRGSFTSEQARHATALWKKRYAGTVGHPGEATFLFEIIYRENRIVCDYGDTDDLFLLAVVNRVTGEVVRPPVDAWPGPAVDLFPYATLAEALAASPREGAEGLVVDLVNRNERVKIKQEDYVALHRIITGCTARRLWEHLAVYACLPHAPRGNEFMVRRLMMAPDRVEQILAAGPDWMERFLRDTPEEFRVWVTDRVRTLITDVDHLRAMITHKFRIASAAADGDRKAFALIVKDLPSSGAMFNLLQGKEIDSHLWREVRPEHELPYRRVDEAVA